MAVSQASMRSPKPSCNTLVLVPYFLGRAATYIIYLSPLKSKLGIASGDRRLCKWRRDLYPHYFAVLSGRCLRPPFHPRDLHGLHGLHDLHDLHGLHGAHDRDRDHPAVVEYTRMLMVLVGLSVQMLFAVCFAGSTPTKAGRSWQL